VVVFRPIDDANRHAVLGFERTGDIVFDVEALLRLALR